MQKNQEEQIRPNDDDDDNGAIENKIKSFCCIHPDGMKWSGKAALGFGLCCLAFSLLFGPGITDSFQQRTSGSRRKVQVELQEKTAYPIVLRQATLLRRSDDPQAPFEQQAAKYSKALLTGKGKSGMARIEINGISYYLDPSLLVISQAGKQDLDRQKQQEERRESDRLAMVEKHRKELERLQKKQEEQAEQEAFVEENELVITILSQSWDGSVLNKEQGVNYGPSGKETYYNLPMEGVISIMRSIGNNDRYWVRDDGVKMLGDYVMVAAHLGLRPRGSLVPTSLGMGIVCDTGTFALTNPTQLDIAVDWK